MIVYTLYITFIQVYLWILILHLLVEIEAQVPNVKQQRQRRKPKTLYMLVLKHFEIAY